MTPDTAAASDAELLALPLSAVFTADPVTGYAGMQNDMPVVRSITLTNTGTTALQNVDVSIACEPAFAGGLQWRFERLEPGEGRTIAPVPLRPDHAWLAGLDEAVRAAIVLTAHAEGHAPFVASQGIEVLAYDQWAGTRALPELLAAFCMPNARVVDRLIAAASVLLGEAPGSPAMDGYQSRSRERVWQQISALYGAVLAQDLHYANPPASFGTDGQKIRTPERILDTKVATCLDLAMLFASCLEQAGLHPVVLLKEGHAWVGAWLIDTCFGTALVDDAQSVRKRVRSGELMVFEATGVAGGRPQLRHSLRLACGAGEDHLADEGAFLCAIDIRRARELHIRPLPSHGAGADAEPRVEQDAPAIEAMPPLPPLDPALLPTAEAAADTPEGRLTRWKGRLLDLTLRNRLLNFKPSKTTLRVICHDPGALEDTLAEGKDFRLRAAPPLMSGTDPREAATFAARTGQSPLDALAADALGRNEILVELPAGQDDRALDARLLEIYRAAGASLEEGGANTLFLVFGLLQWRDAWVEGDGAQSAHLAPILMVPVTLTRQSVRSGFRLVRHDDEALVNPTLVQKLAQDFELKLPAFDVLPSDDKGIDVAGILQSFRLHVGELKGWEVLEQVHLGIFSFTKYLMWKDLQDRHRQLRENPVVAQLIEHPGEAFARADLGFAPRTLDAAHRPDELFAPLLSDSSQLRAICVADSGTDLVIEGPPGTGKSQTITNLIAHLLATGKSVLFVSEKMAALEVVHRRLNAIGLGPFSLELHSSKARKADVIRQLGIALDAAGTRTVKDWELEASRLAGLRAELNQVALALHRLHPNDLTIHEAIGTCIEHAGERPAAFAWTDPDAHTRTDLEIWRETSRQIGALASQLPTLAGHALARIGTAAWSPSWEQDLLDSAAALAARIEALQAATTAPLQLLGAGSQGLSLDDLATLDKLADTLLAAPRIPAGVARVAHDEAILARLAALREHGLARNRAWQVLAGRYADDTAQLSAVELRREWAAAQATWWPRSWFARRALQQRLQAYRMDGQRPGEADVAALLDALATVNEHDGAIAAMAGEAGAVLGADFGAHRTDWEAVARAEHWARDYAQAIMRLAGGDPEVAASLRANLLPYVSENRMLLASGMPVGTQLGAYREAWRAFAAQLRQTSNLGGCGDHLGLPAATEGALAALAAIVQGWQRHARQLRPWCLWQGARARAVNSGLQGIVAALEAGDVALARVPDYFEYSYRNWWVRKAIDRESVLCTFSSADHERKIREFRQADERFQQLTQQYVAASLAARIPAAAALATGSDSELGRLRRELQKQRRHMPIRQLIAGLPTLLPRLKPCLLMSPLSVAQYLDADHAQFDVVIFDEASQIPVWDAVGAIARGRQLICVGDPKQLPPTSFFNRADDGEEASLDAEVQDLESILDECLGIGLPQLTLNWHYRSRHESLIAFSNATYYGNALVTFPSPVTEDTAVRFQHVPGVYDRGGTKTNRAEAEAIVAAIERHYLGPQASRQTLGVVTFNSAQQALVERLLEERRRANPALDAAIAAPAREALFVKNLENVQGDERDIILFSITYGPDAQGKVSLNFGPLNLEGGQRRLNVAISRARQAVVIFSTLLPEQIDLARVRASGVRDLRNYLEFAMHGPGALAAQPARVGDETGGGCEGRVAAALRERGWTVHRQVGVSGLRVDLGVVDPRAPGRYLLGIECDGPSYHSGATARDRDRLRQHVLEGLGWNLFRIWSTDWWLDPDEPLGRLLARLDELVRQEESRAEVLPAEAGAGESTLPPAAASSADSMESTGRVEGVEGIETVEPVVAIETVAAPALPDGAALYVPVALPKGEPERFHEPASAAEQRHQLNRIIHEEGPVAQAVLLRRVIRAWGLARTGSRIEKHLAALLPAQIRTTVEGGVFYWPEHLDPATWTGYRLPGADPEARRAIDEIALEELGNIALYVLAQQGSTTQAGLARAVCRLLGMARTSAEAEERIGRALAHGRVAALVTVGDGVASLRA